MKLVKPNWYGFDHDKVNELLEGDLTFVNDFCVNEEYSPSAVYRASRPNISKGHKRYVLLTRSNDKFYARGMDEREIQRFRYQAALHCLKCDDVIYSVNRHDFRSCSCASISIDGGRDYTKVSFQPDSLYKEVVVDLLQDIISDPIKSHGKKEKKKKAKKAKA